MGGGGHCREGRGDLAKFRIPMSRRNAPSRLSISARPVALGGTLRSPVRARIPISAASVAATPIRRNDGNFFFLNWGNGRKTGRPSPARPTDTARFKSGMPRVRWVHRPHPREERSYGGRARQGGAMEKSRPNLGLSGFGHVTVCMDREDREFFEHI